MRSPAWQRDELILALDVYLSLRPRTPSPSLREISELGNLLRDLPLHERTVRPPNFRSPSSVVMKLMNFRSIDPEYAGVGPTSAGRADQDIWDEFAHRPEILRQIASAIKGFAVSAGKSDKATQFEQSLYVEDEEGHILSRQHFVRERNAALVRKKKQTFLKKNGSLYCETCNFSFSETYGSRGDGFIECHHVRPLSCLRAQTKTTLDDLILLCSNCHRMVHVSRPWLSMDELRMCLQQERS